MSEISVKTIRASPASTLNTNTSIAIEFEKDNSHDNIENAKLKIRSTIKRKTEETVELRKQLRLLKQI